MTAFAVVGLVTMAFAGVAVAASAPIGATRHHHHHHDHHHDDCDERTLTDARSGHEHSDDCGPPPTVPEVPWTLLLPLSGAFVGGLVVVVRRRRPHLRLS
ncbi:MAG: hypothetical protein ACXVJX_07800 [Acidimicrobiia bacterium]